MTVIPAQVAGVERIVVASPRPARETLAAASLLGITEFYRVGGAQAIAALAYGTRSVPRVAKIIGPGNLYVTAAKQMVAFDCAIDMLAGPTEALIFSDTANPAYLAADLVAQAEHDPAATCVLITTRRRQATAVAAEVSKQAKGNAIAGKALARNGGILLARSREEALAMINAIAPEHVTVDAADVEAIRSAGSIFAGAYSPQPVGDYCSGPNHVLPTGGVARWRGGLSVSDFLKVITVQELSPRGLARLAPTAETLAEAEGLGAHAAAVRIRLPRARRIHA
jgi:histidinol dehydrogenase